MVRLIPPQRQDTHCILVMPLLCAVLGLCTHNLGDCWRQIPIDLICKK